MKKLLITALLSAGLLLPLGTIAQAEREEIEPESQVEYQAGTVPAQCDVSAMSPAIHAALLSMQAGGQTTFPNEEDVDWEVLYNLLSMYGQLDERSVYEGDELILPSETVWDYSSAIFAVPLDPADLPQELSDRITYDPQADEYRLYCGSDALAEVRILETDQTGADVKLSGELVYLPEEEALLSFTGRLVPADTMFGYILAELKLN